MNTYKSCVSIATASKLNFDAKTTQVKWTVINITAHCDVDDNDWYVRTAAYIVSSRFSLEMVAMDTPLEVSTMKIGY